MEANKISLTDVSSLCSYSTRRGDNVWVGECPAGYFYAIGDEMHFTNRLIVCFRFMPTINHEKPDSLLANLRRLSGSVPSSLVAAVRKCLPTANGFAILEVRKDSTLPFKF